MGTCQEVKIDGTVCGLPVTFRVILPGPAREVCSYHKRHKVKTERIQVFAPPRKRCTDYDHWKIPRSPGSRSRIASDWRNLRASDRMGALRAFVVWRDYLRKTKQFILEFRNL